MGQMKEKHNRAPRRKILLFPAWFLAVKISFSSTFLTNPTSAAWLSTATSNLSSFDGRRIYNNHPGKDYCLRLRKEQSSLFYTPRSQFRDKDERDEDNKNENNNVDTIVTTTNYNNEDDSNDLTVLQMQAAKLREEAESLQSALQKSKIEKIELEKAKVDGWIDDLLIETKIDGNTDLLKNVDQVFACLQENRYSAEQVLKIFKRLCEIRQQESRSNCSPLMSLLVDATGKLDCTEREDNPNKRWNHKVERILRKKLFARDWNMEYVSDEEEKLNT